MNPAAQNSLRSFAEAMATADRYRNILARRYGYSAEQIKAIADTAIQRERAEYERGEIKRLGELVRAAKRKRQ
jgi:hypothetical protein